MRRRVFQNITCQWYLSLPPSAEGDHRQLLSKYSAISYQLSAISYQL
ncbi:MULTISPECIES: hypothetical protein [unclassified Moorena]|nr:MULTISPECIES: hypothetical protein [unclassified Moorena]NEP34385.1 hypothetical protein [Moorena sp. SIO3B2]NEQ17590.1 hypothetical protein [Moorena sp. SIO3E2]NES43159.1 hypothetical protein [Moorena sp. SIO2C4]